MSSGLDEAVRVVTKRLGPSESRPRLGIVLGSGLGDFARAVVAPVSVPYAEIPGFPVTAVAGHAGELVTGEVAGVRVVCLAGRVHLYEGYSPERVVFGVRLLAQLGCRAVILTNAAGGIREGFAPGSLVLISDHLNLTGANPLVGTAEPSFPRFPDMTKVYDPRLRELARLAAGERSLVLEDGVYAGVLGPSYETPSEIRMLKTLGADVVGMSTVLEAIALRQRGVRVAAVSVVTNLAAGLAGRPLDHGDVQAAGAASRGRLEALLEGWIARALPELG